LRRLLAFLITLALVLVGADFGLRFLSEFWAGRQLERSLDLPSRPSVSLDAFPYIPHLVSGDVATVTVRTGSLRVEGARIDRLALTLHDVHFSTRQLLYGKQATIRARRGEGTAVVTSADLTTTILGQETEVHILFRGSRVAVTSDRFPVPVEGSVSLDGSVLVVRSDDPRLPISLSAGLPQLVAGLRYTAVRLADFGAELSFALASTRFDVER
jgi:hypothetical protein